jgi:hypothetical protein
MYVGTTGGIWDTGNYACHDLARRNTLQSPKENKDKNNSVVNKRMWSQLATDEA